MEITGPFLDRVKKRARQPSCWFLRYSTPKLKPDGTSELNAKGRPVLLRHRPYYESKAKAEADKPRILDQHQTAGAGDFLFDRGAADDYSAAKKIAGDVSLVEVAKFWRLHHPATAPDNCRGLYVRYMADMIARQGKPAEAEGGEERPARDTRHISDLRSRVGAFVATKFGERFPATITRRDILDYVNGLEDVAPRTRRNHKNSLSAFFGWIRECGLIAASPAAGIKRRHLPREQPQEIRYLSLEEMTQYLRAAERYDPDLVAHEVVQLIAGVRADDEMRDFRGEFVLAKTKEIVIPAAVAKTEKRQVIGTLEANFWDWWRAYGPKEGLLRPKNYGPRWDRIRYLSSLDQSQADRLARLPIKFLLRTAEAKKAVAKWPWNARRRTFCTYHVAKHQSADKTALILRHVGSASTLHDSYRGLGVTQEDGVKYFELLPESVTSPIRPEVVLRGVVKPNAQAKSDTVVQ